MLDRYDQDLLLDYLEGELDSDRHAQLQSLLAEDAQLAALLEAMAGDRAALRTMPRVQAPADLVHDATQSLERRMLLDDEVVETGPIPIARGRDLPGEATGGLHWGRIAGLSALAASVALAAGVVVTTLGPDPLTRTAENLADNKHAGATPGEHDAAVELGLDTTSRNGGGATAEGAAAPELLTLIDPERRPEHSEDLHTNRIARTTPEGPPRDPRTERSAVGPGAAADRIATDAGVATQPPATQPAAALAVAELRQQLVLFTEEPELTREQLVAYCVTNGIPIVQTNLPINNNDYRVAPPRNADREPGQTDEQALDGNYALLVDERMLDKLLLTMNQNTVEDVAAPNARKANALQAALLAEIMPAQIGNQIDNHAELAQDPASTDDGKTTEPAQTHFTNNAGRPIELRLPGDLGSSYANLLNRHNFNAEQQRNSVIYNNELALEDAALANQTQANKPAAGLADAQGTAPDAVTPDPVKEQTDKANQLEHSRTPKHTSNTHTHAPADDVRPVADDNPKSDSHPDALRDDAPPAKTLDPTRGNWLTPHLPLANTTPILNWSQAQPQRAAQLVPIIIQRAPTEQVNSVRLQQQAQYKQRDQAETVKPDEADRSVPADPADETDETQATPQAQSPAEPAPANDK